MIRTFSQMIRYPEVACFFTDRHGGFGCGSFGTFNCNAYCGDDIEAVRKNRALLVDALQAGCKLVVPHQTHSANIFIVDDKYVRASTQQRICMLEGFDSVVTSLAGYVACVSTADCIPVLLYDVRNRVVAAVHAGWRGTVKRIVIRTIEAMMKKYGTCGEDIVACIGPGISLAAFEVGDEVYDTFSAEGFEMSPISVRNRETDKWHINLKECNRQQLMECGVREKNIEVSDICTYSQYEDFFSARRLTIRSGRILSGMLIKR